MAELSATSENASQFRVINEERLSWLEAEIDSISSSIETPREFIVPGDTSPGAALSLARSIIRRAERRVAELHLAGKIDNQQILPYLNRLSSLCFVLELMESKSSIITRAKKDR
jgi:cob(I)alamin adenosyltransferase